jgi:predicted alpha/beta-hydrolase family hydrolase
MPSPAAEELRIAVAGATDITAVRTRARAARWTFVYAPGAGSNIRDPFGAFAAGRLAAHNVTTVRFQFPYMEAGRSGPDRPPVLEATWRAVIDAARDRKTRLVVGGRSMGGRIASMVVADGHAVDALALFAYPLHPPGHPEKARVEHLPRIAVPALFCCGTNVAFGSPDELKAASRNVRGAKLHLLGAADHGFAVKKSSGRTREDVWAEAVDVLVAFLAELGPRN